LAQEELSNFVLRAGLRKGRAEIQELAFIAPGQTRITAAGEIGLTIEGGGGGRVTLATDATDRLLRYLGRLDIALPFANAIEGQPLEASADVTYAPPVASFRNLRMKIGEAAVTGSARFMAPEGSARGKLDAAGTKTVTVKLTPKARKKLRRLKKVAATLKVAVTDSGGAVANLKRSVSLKP